jgi:hypothetical protein
MLFGISEFKSSVGARPALGKGLAFKSATQMSLGTITVFTWKECGKPWETSYWAASRLDIEPRIHQE